jgi:serine protein kinase
MENDYRQVILLQRSAEVEAPWEGTALDYLKLVKETPDIANFAPGRVYNMIINYGTEPVAAEEKIRGYEDLVAYKFFNKKMFGTYQAIHDIMKFLKASARRTETGKRILIMVGPVSSGKSTIASMMKRGLERDKTAKYAIKNCPIHEEPLHLIPVDVRPYWEKELGVKIEGGLCPVCLQEHGDKPWEDVPVEKVLFSEQKRVGIGTFQPSDPKSQDISELIGRVNMSKMTRYGETDPRAYQFNGELQIANGGMIEYIEILKADVKFHYVLLTAAQEQVIKSPGFPQMYIDTLILSHTNQTEFDTFKADKKNEALHDRMYPVYVPWNVKVSDEIKIYQKMISESDFRNIHISPGALKVAAQFAVMSRLKVSSKISSLIEKMKIYDGEISEEMKKQEVDVKALRDEGRVQGEGMSGVSPRFIINAINVALGMKEDKKCVDAIDILRALRQNFDHQIGITDEEKTKYINLLLGEKESVSYEYKQFARKEVNMSFLSAYDEQAQSLFENYMMNVAAYVGKEKVTDSITGETSDPDEKLMRSIEEPIGIPSPSKDEFRKTIFYHKASKLEKGQPFTFKDYGPLREGIEKKLINDLKNVVSLTIADKTVNEDKAKRRRHTAIQNLINRGYCDECANRLLQFIGEILRKES